MQITINQNAFFIFDLDDTLFREIDFLKSAYRHIAALLEPFTGENIYEAMLQRFYKKENVFEWIINANQDKLTSVDVAWLLKQYREHLPTIQLSKETQDFLYQVKMLNISSGLITDGRSVTQRNKLKVLQLEEYFTDVIISEEFGSEKPCEHNYLFFEQKYPGKTFYFFGDNLAKDFTVPAKLHWTTVCIKDCGHHIHKQHFDDSPLPDHIIHSFDDITLVAEHI